MRLTFNCAFAFICLSSLASLTGALITENTRFQAISAASDVIVAIVITPYVVTSLLSLLQMIDLHLSTVKSYAATCAIAAANNSECNSQLHHRKDGQSDHEISITKGIESNRMSFRSLKTNSSEIAHLPGTPQAKSVGNYTDDKSEISCGNNSIHRQVSETPESVCKPRKDKEEKNVL
eukprot:jgi/Bigna1/87571/estExt_fgenesh1_pg.C_220007